MDIFFEAEQYNKKKSLIWSICIHFILLLILFIKWANMIPADSPSSAIMIEFAASAQGSDSSSDAVQPPTITKPNTNPPAQEIKANTSADEAPVKVSKGTSNNATTSTSKNVNKASTSTTTSTDKPAETNNKSKYADLINKSKSTSPNGSGADINGKDPDSKALEGLSKGSSKMGEGLTGRGVLYEPVFKDNSQKTGRVALTLCVNAQGSVISAKFTQKGSTSSDSYLIDLAEKTALKYKFATSTTEKQCGTVIIEFKLQ